MKISDCIEYLTALQAEYGDLPVCVTEPHADVNDGEIKATDAFLSVFMDEQDKPECVVFVYDTLAEAFDHD